MPTCPPLYVPPPNVQRYGYGLFSVAQFPVTADQHWRCGVEWEPYACDQARTVGDWCDAPNAVKNIDDGVALVEATPFVVYDGYLCRSIGRSEADIVDRARTNLELGEQRAVEETLWTGALGNRPYLANPAAVVLNATNPPAAGDALNMVAAIAALEGFLGENYGGIGVIHAPRSAIPVMARYHQLVQDGPVLRTWLGTAVAAGGGYVINTGPNGTPAPPGTAWLYATGPIAIRRSEIFINPDTVAAALDRPKNEIQVVAEREYVVGFDCLLGAVLADISH